MFENHQKCRISYVSILALSINFCPIKIDMSGNTSLAMLNDTFSVISKHSD